MDYLPTATVPDKMSSKTECAKMHQQLADV